MSEQTNVRTLKDAYSSFKKGDVESVLKVLTDDVEWITPGPADLMPVAGKRRGQHEVAEFFFTLKEQENVEVFEPHEYIAQGDKVVALIKYRGRVRATGRTVEADLVHVFTFANGKIRRFQEYYDTAATLDAYKVTRTRASGVL